VITNRSTYDQCVQEIDLAVKEVILDQDLEGDVSEDEVWCDMAASILLDASESTAREVCRVQLGFVPMALEAVWSSRKAAKRAADLERERAKTVQRRADAEAAAEAKRLADLEKLRAARCPTCFTVPSASGACLC
jgi:hypothetical protein